MYRWLVIISLIGCAKVKIDTRGVDTPRGWTIDKSSGDVTASQAFDQGKTLKVDSFDSEEGITTEVMMSASDNIENIKTNIKKFNDLVSINVVLRNALKERQDKTCFIRNYIKQLEVRVHTRLSPLRDYDPQNLDDSRWPKITVDLGDENKFNEAKAIDNGVVVFHREYLPNDEKKNKQFIQTIAHIQKISVELASKPVLRTFTELFGRKQCTSRGFGFLSCKGRYYPKKTYYEEANKVIVDKVEVLVRIDDNDRFYKIFSDEPKIELSSSVRQYNFAGFKQNPHWVLHAYSSKCDGWQGDHDGSVFAKEIWQHIQDKKPIAEDLFWKTFQCANQGLSPILITPENPNPDITDDQQWLEINRPFAPHDNTTQDRCKPVTAQSIINDASKTTVNCHYDIPDDLDDRSEETLEVLRDELQTLVNKGEESNANLQESLDDLSKSGCFYDQKLTDVNVKIEGQYLFDFAGSYRTKEKANEIINNEGKNSNGLRSAKIPLYINLGLSNKSYPLGKFFPQSNTDEVTTKNTINPEYTKNFTIRDITFVHISRGGNPDELIDIVELNEKFHNACWNLFGCQRMGQGGNLGTFAVESGIVHIQKIALYHGGDTDPFYEREAEVQSLDRETGVKGGLFTLNSVVNSWTDYNIKDNLSWQKRRKYACSD